MQSLRKIKKAWYIGVVIFILVFSLCSYISYRTTFLQTLEIGEEYLSIFEKNYEYKIELFIANFIIIFIVLLITNRLIKGGLKVFFDDEKKEMPKLLNKSLALVISIIASYVITNILLEKYILFLNMTWFGKTDPVFNLDIGFYFFQKPFIVFILKYLVLLFIGIAIYKAIYYVWVFNIYLKEIDGELLKKNRFVKLLKIDAIIVTIGIATITYLNSFDIVFNEFITLKDALSTKLIGAGITNITIKLWGYRILSVVMIISVILILKNILDKEKTKKLLKSIFIVPAYLVILFFITILFNVMVVNNNKLDKEKEYIKHNIEYTKAAYNINIEEEEIENSAENITNRELKENDNIIENIKLINEDTTLKTLNSLQTSSGYYSYKTTKLQKYEIDGKDTIVYVSPREIKSVTDTSTYDSKTYEYTHGFGTIITYANKADENGNIEYVQKGFYQENNDIYALEPRIYFGLDTKDAIIVNSNKKQEFDYPISSIKMADYNYLGKAGIKADFIDRLILSLTNSNVNVTFSDKDSKIILNRNVIKRAEKIMPYLIYDENPYIVITKDGRLVWVLDAYTVSNAYPYSQKSTIKNGNSTTEINYIRNSVKVLIDAYDGTINFYLMDETDPIAIAYSHAYPDLFKSKENIDNSISSHFVYSDYLYNVQSDILKLYHNVTEDVLYRGDDIWGNATFNESYKTNTNTELESYYTMIKENGENKIGLILPYTSYKKQNIVSYLVGTVNSDNIPTLKIYKYVSGSNVLGPAQLDKEIEQDETISKTLQTINVTGTKVIKDIIIVPIADSLLYVEPIYQQQLNEKNSIPLLKKVVVAFGNKLAIGDTLSEALENLISQTAVKIKVESTDTIDGLIESIIDANKNLTDSSASQDFEMIGKDITKLQNLIKQLEEQRQEETEKKEKIEKEIEESQNKIIETTSISREFKNE